MFVFFVEAEPNIAKTARPQQQAANMVHRQRINMEVESSTPALISIFAPVRFVILVPACCRRVAGSEGRLTVFPRHLPALGSLLLPTRLGLLLAGIKCA